MSYSSDQDIKRQEEMSDREEQDLIEQQSRARVDALRRRWHKELESYTDEERRQMAIDDYVDWQMEDAQIQKNE
jgi:hypothetical protein